MTNGLWLALTRSYLSTNGHEYSLILYFCFRTILTHFGPFRSWPGVEVVPCGPLVGHCCHESWIPDLEKETAVSARAGTTGFATTEQGRAGGEVPGRFYIPGIMVEKGKAEWQGVGVSVPQEIFDFFHESARRGTNKL